MQYLALYIVLLTFILLYLNNMLDIKKIEAAINQISAEKKKPVEEKIEALKDIQKAKLKKILGKARYEKYKKLKDKDIL